MYGAHDGDGAFGMTGEQLLEGGIEMTNIRLFRFLLMSKPHSPNGALAQYRWKYFRWTFINFYWSFDV